MFDILTANCTSGEEYNAVQLRCVRCARGTFREQGSATDDFRCQVCPSGKTTPAGGYSECLVGEFQLLLPHQ